MVAARMMPLYQEEARERMLRGNPKDPTPISEEGSLKGEATKIVGDMLGVGKTQVWEGKELIDKAIADVLAAVDNGEINVHPAYEISKLPKEQQVTALADYRNSIGK